MSPVVNPITEPACTSLPLFTHATIPPLNWSVPAPVLSEMESLLLPYWMETVPSTGAIIGSHAGAESVMVFPFVCATLEF